MNCWVMRYVHLPFLLDTDSFTNLYSQQCGGFLFFIFPNARYYQTLIFLKHQYPSPVKQKPIQDFSSVTVL